MTVIVKRWILDEEDLLLWCMYCPSSMYIYMTYTDDVFCHDVDAFLS